ncbi:MAG: phosphoglucosamine mutase [Anaeroplasma sp.]
MKYFGTDGIRGIPGDSLSYDLLYRIGKALYILGNKNVLIACDTRVSCNKIINCLIEGMSITGINIHLLGVLPTPVLLYESKMQNAIGVMITASHNPYYDNGVKIVLNGEKLTDEEQSKIEALIDKPTSIKQKSYIFYDDYIVNNYLDYIVKFIKRTNLKIAIDCANGATYKIAPIIFSKITDKLIIISNNPNGYNINENCGSTHLEKLQKVVLANKCDIGFAFDGDGDRVLCVDSMGRIIDGDLMIYILAIYLKKINKLNKNTVVLTIMSNPGIIKAMHEMNIKIIESNVGDRYVIEQMVKNDLSLGGENSGHIIMRDYFNSGDGILTAVILLSALNYLSMDISIVRDNINLVYDKMVNIKKEENSIINSPKIQKLIVEAHKGLGDDSKIIIRPSGTERLIRVSVMGNDKNKVNHFTNLLVEAIKNNEELT